MKQYTLTFFQTFNAMRVFFSIQYDKTQSDKLGTLCGALNLWKQRPDWQENPQTFDPTAWQDWIDAVNKTLKDLYSTSKNPKDVVYDEETAFLCMKNYLQHFYDQTSWESIKMLLQNMQEASTTKNSQLWSEWLEAIDHALHETYELDVYFDPFSGKRMD